MFLSRHSNCKWSRGGRVRDGNVATALTRLATLMLPAANTVTVSSVVGREVGEQGSFITNSKDPHSLVYFLLVFFFFKKKRYIPIIYLSGKSNLYPRVSLSKSDLHTIQVCSQSRSTDCSQCCAVAPVWWRVCFYKNTPVHTHTGDPHFSSRTAAPHTTPSPRPPLGKPVIPACTPPLLTACNSQRPQSKLLFIESMNMPASSVAWEVAMCGQMPGCWFW